VDAFAEALVGEVEKGIRPRSESVATTSDPLRRRQVAAGRVVAAGMQDDDGVGGRSAQVREHRREVDRVRLRVVVRVALDREPGAFEERPVVLPAGIADQHLRPRPHAAQEVGPDLQPAGAADACTVAMRPARRTGCRHRRPAPASRRRSGDAIDRQVAACLGRSIIALRPAHALEQRQLAVLVVVDARR
jgi:hypothetical protein